VRKEAGACALEIHSSFQRLCRLYSVLENFKIAFSGSAPENLGTSPRLKILFTSFQLLEFFFWAKQMRL
jgi:hypothetical protein